MATTNNIPKGTGPDSLPPKEPNKLILCFDGTGNTFSGSNADTNVVKTLNKLDRHHPRQYHYYQTGVGTYDVNETSVNKSWIGEIRSFVSQTVDQAIGTTLDSHVMAGYRFLMRYYEPGDKIYMFGFSRGAFTAKFLARMVHTAGLLCKGNEEMVPFAYRLYQRYLAGEVADFKDSTPADLCRSPSELTPLTNGNGAATTTHDEEQHAEMYNTARNEVTAFSSTFCRQEAVKDRMTGKIEQKNVKVYFLGLWDCVNSVAVLEHSPMPVPVKGTTHYVRHAVAVDERRVKFNPALLAQDVRCAEEQASAEDIKEVWFPGCHGDVGGGWPASKADNLVHKGEITMWHRFKHFWTTLRPKGATSNIRNDAFQMSDGPLSWMIRELDLVGAEDESASVKWSKNVEGYKKAFATEESQMQALKGFIHDSLRFGRGAGLATVLLWKFMEWLPIITRWELEGKRWKKVRFPLNQGSFRDIPDDAVLHESLIYRLREVEDYCPGNNHGGRLDPCLEHKGKVSVFSKVDDKSAAATKHQTYRFLPTTGRRARDAGRRDGAASSVR